jgi:hypothetical protein
VDAPAFSADDLLALWFTLHHMHEVAERRRQSSG